MQSISTQILRSLLLASLFAHPTLFAAEIEWRFEAEGRLAGKPAITERRLYITGGNTVYALTLAGKELWRKELAGNIAAAVAVDGDRLYVHSSAGLHALTDAGKEIWTYESPDPGPLVDGRTWGWGNEILADPWGWYRSAPTVHRETVVFGSGTGVHAVSKDSGDRVWAVPGATVTADLVVYEETIVAASWNNSIYGLDSASGKVRWRFQAQLPASKGLDWIGYRGFHLTPVLHEGRVFAGTRGTYFYAINAEDGTEAWSSKVGSSWIGSPAMILDEGVYYGLSDGFALMGFRHDTGAQTLFFRTASPIFAQPQPHGKKLVFGTLAGRLFSIDTVSGEGQLLINLGPEENLYPDAFKPENMPKDLNRYQAIQWSIDRLLTNAQSVLNLTIHDGTAYVGTGSGVLYAVNLDLQGE
ncbi:MAG: PQQ-binding-like beta-propeller repeat protein [Gammaproteobacteria bacterium]|nr:PQQ-binding-like beta-propeller repeat protein [Gammaproteobacteria bacterium]